MAARSSGNESTDELQHDSINKTIISGEIRINSRLVIRSVITHETADAPASGACAESNNPKMRHFVVLSDIKDEVRGTTS